MAFAIMRCAKLKGGAIAASDRHTERSMNTPNADPARTEINICLRGERGDDVKQQIRNDHRRTRKSRPDKGFAKMPSGASNFSSKRRQNILKNL